MSEVEKVDLLQQCAEAFKTAHKSLMVGGAMLYQIKKENLWEADFGSYSAYLDFIGISDSVASKITTVYEHYVIKGGFSQRKLEEVDYEKLYLATRLKGEPETQLIQAQTLTRSEIKAELSEKGGEDCTHPNEIKICPDCHKRLG